MKIIVFKSVLIIFVLTLLTNCKKYEEGPLLSIRSVKKRLEGTWKATKQVENGTEYLNDWRFTFEQDEVSKDPEGGYYTYTLYTSDSSNYEEKYNGTWKMSDDKKRILMHNTSIKYNYGNGWQQASWSYDLTWNIVRLKMKEMWIDCSVNGNNYYYEFEKI